MVVNNVSSVYRAGRLAISVMFVLCAYGSASAAPPGIHDPGIVATARPSVPATPQGAGPSVLTFEGLQDAESVNNFYNGGTGGAGSGPGQNFGISFSANSVTFIDSDAGGTGNFGGEPSPDTTLAFLSGAAATMNVPAGFTTGFSFFYSSPFNTGVVRVYDGLNATGNILATLNLPLTPNTGAPDPTGVFSPLVPFGVTFSGTARSVDFGGTVNSIGFDNITLGSGTPGGGGVPAVFTPVPLTTPVGLAAFAALFVLAGALFIRWRRRAQ